MGGNRGILLDIPLDFLSASLDTPGHHPGYTVANHWIPLNIPVKISMQSTGYPSTYPWISFEDTDCRRINGLQITLRHPSRYPLQNDKTAQIPVFSGQSRLRHHADTGADTWENGKNGICRRMDTPADIVTNR